ncbi:hypothetical protein PCE1_003092 [Barthelona sp. PCE]
MTDNTTSTVVTAKCRYLVADAGTFFRPDVQLHLLAENICTTPGVIAEVRDRVSRDRLASNPALGITGLDIVEPSQEAIQFIRRYAHATGDLSVLSEVDMGVAALAYDVTKQYDKSRNIRPMPEQSYLEDAQLITALPKRNKVLKGVFDEDGFRVFTKDTSSRQERKIERIQQEQTQEEAEAETCENVEEQEEAKEEALEFELDDEDMEIDDNAWITEYNVEEHLNRDAGNQPEKKIKQIKVATMTGDLALQNLLVRMALVIIGTQGQKITKFKSFILRCRSCSRVERNMRRVFCGSCGYQSLERTPYYIDKKGRMRLPPIRSRTLKGIQYDAPMPKGGRTNIVWNESELLRRNPHAYKEPKNRTKGYDPNVSSHVKQTRSHRDVQVGLGRRNPNIPKKRHHKKKKSRR